MLSTFSKTYALLKEHAGDLGKRAEGFELALRLITRPYPRIIELGTARQKGNWLDGQSTLLFAQFVAEQQGLLETVDILPEAIVAAKDTVPAEMHQYVHFTCNDSILALQGMSCRTDILPVDLIYYDSLDYNEENPRPSQEHCLGEVLASVGWQSSNPNDPPFVHEGTILMFDDCDLRGGGKQGLAEVWLRDNGWHEIFRSKQSIWVKRIRY